MVKEREKKRNNNKKLTHAYHQDFPSGVTREERKESHQQSRDPYYASIEELSVVHSRIFSGQASLSILGTLELQKS